MWDVEGWNSSYGRLTTPFQGCCRGAGGGSSGGGSDGGTMESRTSEERSMRYGGRESEAVKMGIGGGVEMCR